MDDPVNVNSRQKVGGCDGCQAPEQPPTNHPVFPDVDFRLQVTDRGEPGSDDEFIIRLGVNGTVIYTTEGDPDRTLGGSGPGGGNIQLHKPNPSTSGSFGGECRI